MNVLQKVFGTHSEHVLKRILPLVDQIEALSCDMEKLTDEELKKKTLEFKARLKKGETLEALLPEAYAVVREASMRVLGIKHYKVQLMGGVILHQGRIAEMKTGEGKTLVATLPAYLNALTGEGVHIVTVNDYLAKRDSEQMGMIHQFLGLSVGVVLSGMNNEERRAAYNCDITYITNNELGFDYLRDNMVLNKEQLVQRGLHYAIIDEVDSVLIDEARTPLIISGQSERSTSLYEACDILARHLQKGDVTKTTLPGEPYEESGDFVVNEKEKIVNLTEEGVKKVEKFFHIRNLADTENLEIQHNIILALRAHNLMFCDQDYVVKDGKILIVDEFTGRLMPGRRYSDGLHQAIEAKEHVEIKRESKTLATITFQNLFNNYDKKSGMTGTALTEEKEFREIYEMDVIEIPSNRPVIRKDLQDAVYKTKAEKYAAVCDVVEESYHTGQPVLVGTITIEVSELLSEMLKKRNIPHQVLNAKFHEQEAAIVAQAGQHGAVTIATNMAGRGTDIKLDEKAKELGGLKIIGTERHESRRIDNQLRGRSGRQGDPGESRFYISLEDDLMRLFGSEKMLSVFQALGVQEGEELEHKLLSKAIERSQERIEGNNFGIRKNLLDYDQVMNEQREIIYAERRRILNGEDMSESIHNMFQSYLSVLVDQSITKGQKEMDFSSLNIGLYSISPLLSLDKEERKGLSSDKMKELLYQKTLKSYQERENKLGSPDSVRTLERVILMKIIDAKWMDHIDDMEQLKQGIGLQAYGQKDPEIEYKMVGYQMFENMTNAIIAETVHALFHVKIADS